MDRGRAEAIRRSAAGPRAAAVTGASPLPLQAVKCRVPVLRPGAVARPRLLEALDRALGGPVTLVSAPAGSGKSTLLVSWAAQRSVPVAWLALEPADGHLTRFLGYLCAALEALLPGRSSLATQLLHGAPPPPADVVLSALVDDLAGAPGDRVAVLDDYHLIATPAVHAAIEFLVEHLPAGLHLAVLSRSDPPLPLARWRGRGILAEVRLGDLRFSAAETGEFLRGTMGLEIDEEASASLTARTEGWAAGLQIAALSLRRHADPAGFIREFAGSHRDVFDYLMGEVLASRPPEVHRFLLCTSILERLSGPLCDAVTGESGGTALLRTLERQGLFVDALDPEGGWFRYHRLLSDLLRHLLRTEHPGLEPELHRRASDWHLAAGLTDGAVAHRLAAGDAEGAARLVEDLAEATLADGQFGTLLEWIGSLPDEVLESRPVLRAFHAIALFYDGGPADAVERVLVDVEAPGAGTVAHGVAAVLRAVMDVVRGEAAAGLAQARRALDLLPADRPVLRTMAGTALGLAALWEGDLGAAEQAFGETLRSAEAGGNLILRVLATRRLAGAALLRGDLHLAEARYRQILAFTTIAGGGRSPLAGPALIGLGQVLRERNELAEAEEVTREGLALAGRLGAPFRMDGVIGLGRVLQARGEWRAAAAAFEEAGHLAARFDVTETDDAYVAALVAGLHLAEGDPSGAAQWAEGLRQRGGAAFDHFYPGENEGTILARVLVADGQPEEALAVLGPLLRRAQSQGRIGSVIELETLRAVALDAAGQPRAAAAALATALGHGAAHGHLRTFLDEGGPLFRLLRRAVESGTVPPYGRSVLRAFGGAPGRSGQAGLVEPLTERERAVLRHLPTPLSIPEIAEHLYVSPSTVRSHVKAIYRKLGVGRRAEAVERGRALGLL